MSVLGHILSLSISGGVQVSDKDGDKPVVLEFRKGVGIVNVIPSPSQIIDTRPENQQAAPKEGRD